ncbi:MAG: OmpA family protein [Treponema sp.]|nr:OmpA family protein [Treponema sp.]
MMKKIIALIFAVSVIVACKGTPPPPPAENPNVGPELAVTIPELFSPDPDVADDTMSIAIAVDHPVAIKDWRIEVNRRGAGAQAGAAARPAGEAGQREGRAQRQGGGQRSRVFFEQSGTGAPPATWQWNGKRTTGEMVQSATDYLFTLTVNDVYGNNTAYEGTISTDVLVIRDGELLRIVVPSIVFPPSSSDFSLLSEDDMRGNARVLGLIARALNRFDDYKVKVEGHANPTTAPGAARNTEEANELKPLSEARAKAVVDYLATNNSVDRTRLSSTGEGGTRTVADWNDTDENWKNRRVEFILQK